MRLAYFDLASGASGDMIMAALIDAGRRIGVDAEGAVTNAVGSLDLGCSITFVNDVRGGLACLRAEVKTSDMRLSVAELRSAVARADLAPTALDRARDGLEAMVAAEATVHGVDTDDVHLHELASPDTAVDLVGSAAALHALGVTDVAAAPVPVPNGWISSDHGALPLPAPVTLELLRGATLKGVDSTSELVTPTGAAILVAHRAVFGPLPEIALHATGTGGGTRETARPNISRVLIGSRPEIDGARHEDTVLLETNIDDQTPESLGHAVEIIMRTGALDAWVTPILMKKTRPAFLLSVLVRPADEGRVLDVVFRNTTTLGVRRRETSRWSLDRTEIRVRVHDQDVRVKIATLGSDVVNVSPEFEDCVAVAEASGLPLNQVMRDATEVARLRLTAGS